MDIAVQEMTLIERTTAAQHLGFDVARAQVLDEQTLETNAAMLELTGDDHENKKDDGDSEKESIAEMTHTVSDIEDEK